MSLGTWFSDLKTDLLADATVVSAGADVRLVWVDDSTAHNSITLVRPDTDPDVESGWAAIGQCRRDDSFVLPGRISYRSVLKNSDAAFVQAADQVWSLLNVVQSVVKSPPTIGRQSFPGQVTGATFIVEPSDQGGWWVHCDFNIEFVSRASS